MGNSSFNEKENTGNNSISTLNDEIHSTGSKLIHGKQEKRMTIKKKKERRRKKKTAIKKKKTIKRTD